MLVNQNLVHVLPPVTDNCLSWISGRGRMVRNYIMISLQESYVAVLGLKLMTPESAVRRVPTAIRSGWSFAARKLLDRDAVMGWRKHKIPNYLAAHFSALALDARARYHIDRNLSLVLRTKLKVNCIKHIWENWVGHFYLRCWTKFSTSVHIVRKIVTCMTHTSVFLVHAILYCWILTVTNFSFLKKTYKIIHVFGYILNMFKEIRQNTVFNVSTSCLLQKLDSFWKTSNVTSVCENVLRRYAANNIRNITVPVPANPSIWKCDEMDQSQLIQSFLK